MIDIITSANLLKHIVISAAPASVFEAFFDADALAIWWLTVRSVTTPRVLGPYAVEWKPSEFTDEVLGRLGGVFRGTIMHIEPGQSFLAADAYWLPPDGDPIGPMALEVTCAPVPGAGDNHQQTSVEVRLSGFEANVRWQRYRDVVSVGWDRALASLKVLVEGGASGCERGPAPGESTSAPR
jgi:uncharacterized protein YndB with AHSA1/START domain